jgi:threonine 3-dehydrogenase
LGNPKEPVFFNIRPDIIHKDARLRGFHGREMYETWSKAESILLSGGLDAGPIVTHKFGLSEYEKAFEVALSGEGCKVMFVM